MQFLTLRVLVAATLLGVVAAPRASAQRADSATVGARPSPRAPATERAPITGPPISPKRALLYSLLVPGLGQAKLDRPNSGALYVAVEAMSLAMAYKSARSIDAARNAPDSLIVGYSAPTSPTGETFPIYELSQLKLREKSRKTQLEDWIAVLLFNHFFSGADAFVAAQLWDLPTILKAEAGPHRASVTTRVYW